MNYEEISYIILCFILASIFISVFFFTYLAKLEGEIIKNQINDVMNDFLTNLNIFLTDDEKKRIGNIILNNFSNPDMSSEDNETADKNKKLLKKSVIFFSILLGIGILIILTMWYINKFSLIDITKYSFILLAVIAVTEIGFANLVTKNYRLIDKNFISYVFLNELEKYKNESD